MEQEHVMVLKEEKLKLEEKYCVRISEQAFDLAIVQCQAVEVLRGACELVLENFRNCAHESEFNEKSYVLRRSLVEIIQLYRDIHPDSQSWMNRIRTERDYASIHMKDFIQEFNHVSLSSEFVKQLSFFKDYASKIADLDCPLPNENSWELASVDSDDVDVTKDVARFLNDLRGELVVRFGSLLTVEACHVAEVVSRLTDVPVTEILPSSREMARYRTKQRLVDQDRVIDEIFDSVRDEMMCRPKGSFLLLGAPGVGKREIAKAIAEHLYCDASRLVEIDMSEYEVPRLEGSASPDYLSLRRRVQDLWDRLSEAVRKRPYSVILLDKIDKAAPFVRTGVLPRVLCNVASRDVNGNRVDFSKSIIFMTSSVGVDHETRNRDLKDDVRKFFGAHLLDYLDNVFVVEKYRDQRAVARLLLREIAGRRFIVHASDAALDVLLEKASKDSVVGAGMAIKKSLLDHIVPHLSTAEGYDSVVVVCVDTLVGTYELDFRFHTQEQYLEDWYFKQKGGTFRKSIADLRIKVESAYRFFELRKECLLLLDCIGQDLSQLGRLLLAICDSIAGETNTIRNIWRRLQTDTTAFAKVIASIINAVVKIIDSPLHLPELPAKHYLFLGLDDDAKRGLVNVLTDSLTTSSGKSLFKHVKLEENNSNGELQKHLLIEQVKQNPCTVLMFDGVEFADDVLYSCLLEIFDKGTLDDDDDEGLVVDFQRTIVILTSDSANRRKIAECLKYPKMHVLLNVTMNQNAKRFRTELLRRVDEITVFDPLMPENGHVKRIHKSTQGLKSMSRLLFEFEA
ncbi:hypothetical protein DH2020_011389 [Rehmannia glutinosa]|uniref:AAA+ ATPase domain-containing protein n=1 Tax=Rehmannia glutinosa TaxID=99300 RepID=A0ABR0XDX6_REHGL